jgi:Ni,Fe-hydrogenase III large subunit
MHDGEVTQALIAEVESMAQFNEWMLANIKVPDRTSHVRAAVHEVNRAHRRVIEAHGVWTQAGNNKRDMIAVCIEFGNLVSSIID